MTMNRSGCLQSLAGLTALLFLCGCATTRHPAVSDEGFPKLSGTGFDAVYLAEDNDPRSFERFSVEPCAVSFRENWLRDQNIKRVPRKRITSDDMRRIEEELADSCRKIFVDALTKMTGTAPEEDAGPGVLALRPAIVDLDVAAPSFLTPGRERSYTTSEGRMTLRLELADASTGVLLGRIIDHRVAGDTGRATLATRSGNMAEGERILRTWAVLLVDLLESAP